MREEEMTRRRMQFWMDWGMVSGIHTEKMTFKQRPEDGEQEPCSSVCKEHFSLRTLSAEAAWSMTGL